MSDPLGKDRARRLARLAEAKVRNEEGAMLLDSAALVAEAVEQDLLIELFHRPGENEELVRRAAARGIRVTPAADEVLRRLVTVETSAGLAAVARLPRPADAAALLARPGILAVHLDGIADPGNLGAIARSAAAFDVGLLMISPGSADPWSPKAMRASAGALLRLPVARLSLGDLPASLLRGLEIRRAVARGGADPRDLTRPARLLLWMGNEAQGPRDQAPGAEIRDVTIVTSSRVESLNVAAAAAILLQMAADPRGGTAGVPGLSGPG